MSTGNGRRGAWAAVFALVGAMACGPHLRAAIVEPPGRVLPEHIKRIYIRQFKNQSQLFGAQADLTLYVNDAFMSDGRLDVVPNAQADVRLEGTIRRFTEFTNATGGDRIPMFNQMTMECRIELWDPYDADRVAPIATYTVPATIQYVTDDRRSIAETDTESRDRLLRQMASNIVQAVLTGNPDPRKPSEEKAIRRWQQRNNPAEREPVMTHPRFPKPTPAGKKVDPDNQ
ncbi:MAG: LPS assembly lipoprotein LptE [Candidatus Sumerlaeaceae bacterium]|nr:LPS assembly lipoprotein LptE [Candidatus Sumerlaeaceae bacterium]